MFKSVLFAAATKTKSFRRTVIFCPTHATLAAAGTQDDTDVS
jgi:hypothetical protein